MAETLSPADRSSLAAEIGSVNMAVGGLLVFDDGPGLGYEAVLARVADRLHLVPRYRQRLQSTAAGFANPVWVDDEGFDLGWHVRRAVLPAPGGDAELAELAGREMSRRLDRSRPLWELTVISGLSDGRAALLAKMHHALVDGVAAVDIGTVLLDPTPEPLDIPAPDGPWEPRAHDRTRHLARLAATPVVRAQKLLLDSATRALTPDPRRAAGDLKGATELLVAARQDPPLGADDAAERRPGPQPPLRLHHGAARRPQARRQGARRDRQRRAAGRRHRHAAPLPAGGRRADRQAARRARAGQRAAARRGGRQRDLDGARRPARRRARPGRPDPAHPRRR